MHVYTCDEGYAGGKGVSYSSALQLINFSGNSTCLKTRSIRQQLRCACIMRAEQYAVLFGGTVY
jgi:hypothetical protein